MKYLIILAILLTGCSGDGSSEPEDKKEPTYIWYGDSRCVDNIYIESRDCIGGRTLYSLKEIDFSYDVIIIHLGGNDMAYRGSAEFGEILTALIKGREDQVYCVLPTQFNYYFDAPFVNGFRQEMLDRCTHTVDPNIDPYHADKIHYTDVNYQQARWALDDILESYGKTSAVQ